MHLELREDIKKLYPDNVTGFDKILSIEGEIYRTIERRQTLRFEKSNKSYFIKKHFGIGWWEIIRETLKGRKPVVSAKNEVLAIRHLNAVNINTPLIAAWGEEGKNPAKIKSFIMTDELMNTINFGELTENWKRSPPKFQFKKTLIERIAKIASKMHQSGLNHRDCYLVHFYVEKNIDEQTVSKAPIYVIDLHRAQIRPKTPYRWIVKDVAGLYFSSKDVGLTKRDLFRFMKVYSNKSLKELLSSEKGFWRDVQKKGDLVYKRHWRKPRK